MKNIIEWYPVERTEERVKLEASKTKRVSITQRVNNKGYTLALADNKSEIAFPTKLELIKYLDFIMVREGIEVEDYIEVQGNQVE